MHSNEVAKVVMNGLEVGCLILLQFSQFIGISVK